MPKRYFTSKLGCESHPSNNRLKKVKKVTSDVEKSPFLLQQFIVNILLYYSMISFDSVIRVSPTFRNNQPGVGSLEVKLKNSSIKPQKTGSA